MQFSHRISLLHRPECLPDYVILIGDRGQVTVTDSGLEVKTTFTPESEDQTTVSSFVFSRETCTFAPSRATSRQSAIIVSINKKGDSLDVKALSVDKEGRIKHLGTVAIPSLKPVVSFSTFPTKEQNINLLSRMCWMYHVAPLDS